MKIIKDSIIYLLSEFIAKITPFLIMPYLARVMGAENYGILSYYQTVIILIIIFIGLSQEGAITRSYYKYGVNSLNYIVATCYIYNVSISLLLIIFFFFLGLYDYIILTLIASFQSLFSVQLAIRQCQKKAKEYLKLQFLNFIFLISSLLFFIKMNSFDNLKSWLYSLLFTYMVCFFIGLKDFKLLGRRKISFRIFKLNLIYFISFGVPLLLHQLSVFAKGNFDKIYIYNFFDKNELGVYSIGVQFASLISVGLMAANKAIVPYYFEYLKKGKITNKIVFKYALISFLFVPIPILFFKIVPAEFYIYLLGKEFEGAKGVVEIFSLSFMFLLPYLIFVNYLFYMGKVLIISCISFISILFYLAFLIYFSKFGVFYIPYSMLIGNIVQVLLLGCYIFLGLNKCK